MRVFPQRKKAGHERQRLISKALVRRVGLDPKWPWAATRKVETVG